MNYHVGRDGQQLGVFPLQDIRFKLANGELRPDDLGWTEGMPDWKPLGQLIPGIAPTLTVNTQPPFRSDNASRSTSPAASGSFHPAGPKPANNLVGAILVTLFCCLPFGIPAIIYASQVDTKYNAGDHHGAAESAAKSKKWMWISFAIGLLASLAYLALMLLGAASGTLETGY